MNQTKTIAAADLLHADCVQECYVLLDDNSASSSAPRSRLYTGFVGQLGCAGSAGLPHLLERMQQHLGEGLYAVALFDYELGAGLHGLGLPAHRPGTLSAPGQAQIPFPAPAGTAAAVIASPMTASAGAARILLFSRCKLLDAAQVADWLAARIVNSANTVDTTDTIDTANVADAANITASSCRHTGSAPIGAARTEAQPPVKDIRPAGIMNISESVTEEAFTAAIARIHAWLEAGDAYQVNYTWRLRFQAYGDVAALYARLRARQPVPYGALMSLPDGGAILSLSPELFLQHRQGVLTARPMKGTAAATGDEVQDRARAAALAADPKNRSENLMIVDLLRNDLGRIAQLGSVSVPQLFEVRRHGEVLQMTSTVQARLRDGLSLADAITAIYPCGSITGAPKRRAMEIITELETGPRGIYTGAIGWFDAPESAPMGGAAVAIGDAGNDLCSAAGNDAGGDVASTKNSDQITPVIGDFCLSVPIRTLALGAANGAGLRDGEMGIGAGIVMESRAAEEFAECRLKGRFLSSLPPEFELIETLYATREEGVRHLPLHLHRLRSSAGSFGFVFDDAAVLQHLQQTVPALPPGAPCRVRLALKADGGLYVTTGKLTPLTLPVKLLLSDQVVEAGQLFQRHKSSVRQRYDAAWRLAESRGAFDMLFFNERDELVEGGRSSVFVLLDGQWCTPPVAAGALPGVMRSVLLADAQWAAVERPITRTELLAAQKLMVCNALRGALDATLCAASYDQSK